MIKVFKFGGASVKDADSVKNVLKVLDLYRGEKIAVVISAMGKTTNALERLLHAYFYHTDLIEDEFNSIRDYHFKIISDLFPDKNHVVSQIFLHVVKGYHIELWQGFRIVEIKSMGSIAFFRKSNRNLLKVN